MNGGIIYGENFTIQWGDNYCFVTLYAHGQLPKVIAEVEFDTDQAFKVFTQSLREAYDG